MPTITIAQPDQPDQHHTFHETFCIVQDLNDDLYWYADRPGPQRGGTYQIWLQSASSDPTIHTLLPAWQLILDGRPIEPGFYQYIRVAGKVVELRYKHYTFVISF